MKKLILISLLPFVLLIGTSGLFRDDADELAITKLANEPQFDCVGRILENNKMIGSCVLVSPNYVLTAAHVVYINQFVIQQKKELDVTEFQFEFKNKMYSASKIVVYPNYSKLTDFDLALIELKTPVRNVNPAVLNTNFDELHAEVTGVGHGTYSIVKPNGFPKEPMIAKKTAGKNIIDLFSGKEVNRQASLLCFDFDSPTNASVNRMGDAKPVLLEYTPSGGDSGGGLFRRKNNNWELIGILSGVDADIENFRKSGNYGDISRWTRIAVFKKWIASEMR